MPTISTTALAALLNPTSVAVIGATERPDASSSFVMRNLLGHGYAGQIYPVHRKAKTVFDLPAVAHIGQLAVAPDVAVICISADYVPQALRDCAESGVKAAVILSSGFAETGEDGRSKQAELVTIAHENNMAICGPNCLGFVGLHQGATLYSTRFPHGIPRGSFALISQSGATAIALSSTGRIGFSYIISAGNCAVTDTADYVRYLATEPHTKVIGIVVEHIAHPTAFADAMQHVHRTGKSVIALYVGRSQSGAAATAAHTGALTSSAMAVEALLRRNGVIAVHSMDEMLETAVLLTGVRIRPKKPGIAFVGVSGGGIAHAVDSAEEVGLSIPPLQPATIEQLREILPPFIAPQNPLDTTGLPFADGSVYQNVLNQLAADPSIGMIAAIQDAPPGLDEAGAEEYLPISNAIAQFSASSNFPIAAISNLSTGYHATVAQPLHEATVPVLQGVPAALMALKQFVSPPMPAIITPQPPAIAPDAAWQARLQSGAPLTEREAKQLLATVGIATPQEALATSADEAAVLAKKIGFPVVMKVESAEILHKTDVGGVYLNLASAEAVKDAFVKIMHSVTIHAPNAAVEGVAVQQMVQSNVEAFVSLTRYDPFGFGLTVGIGGTLVELMQETVFDLLPVDASSIYTLLASSKLDQLLAGYRGAASADKDALCDAILKLTQLTLLYGDDLTTIELNPIAVLPAGNGIYVLDALIL